jgi:transcriptional regulator with PAS, ATPase and Fis domain
MEYFPTKRFTDARRWTPSLNRRVLDFLLSCDWPGRMRELENLALKIVVFGKTCESNPAGKKAFAANERGFSICPATG